MDKDAVTEQTIMIIGLGLIGSSIARGIKKAHPKNSVLGYDQETRHRDIALKEGIVDRVYQNWTKGVEEADVIFLAVPIQATLTYLEQLAHCSLKEGVVITDTGSTKSSIVAKADQVFDEMEISFIGGHPMAGSHKSGPLAADAHLFENAYYLWTPGAVSRPGTREMLEDLLQGLKARFVSLEAKEHDQVMAQISHFPHVLSALLMDQAADYARDHEWTRRFAAGGFRDMTRIAESEPGMWTSIFLSNQKGILERLADFQSRLDQLSKKLGSEDETGIYQQLKDIREQRQEMEIYRRGGLEAGYDLFVRIPDQEDIVLGVLEVLRGISFVNVQIMEDNREDIEGVLRLTFKNNSDQLKALKILEEKTPYGVSIR